MKIQKIEGKEERHIIIGMIVSDQFLARISSKYEKEMFKSRWSNLVAEWCIKFFERYHKAPNKEIEKLYSRWAEKSKEKDAIALVGNFLSGLSKSYKSYRREIQVDTLVDQAADHFNKVKLLKLRDEIEEQIDNGEIHKAKILVDSFAHIDMGESEVINPFQDAEIHKQVYLAKSKPFFRYGGAIGDFFGDQLKPENFIAFEGADKSNKSFWLQDVCHRGAMNRVKTAFFGIGDMSKNQTIQRYQARLARRPLKRGRYKYPVQLDKRNWEYSKVKRKTLHCKKDITYKEIEEARERFVRHHIRSKIDYFKMLCSSNLGLSDIKSQLQMWKDKEGWEPQIIAIDYADLLDAPKNRRSKVEEVDENWRQMRFMALERHCLMLTATQVRRSGYNHRWIGINDTGDSKTKLAHVTGMIGINYDENEWKTQRRRLSWIRIREITKRNSVHVAGCLAIANPCILSV